MATLAYEYPRGTQLPQHAHGSDQLIFAISGVMEVSAGQSMWLIPPQFALWIPALTYHHIHMPGPVSMRTLYFRPGLVVLSSPGCRVLNVTPLLRELIVDAVRIGRLRAKDHDERALCRLLISRIGHASPVPTFLTLPKDLRALAVAQAVIARPEESKTVAVLCAEAGVSVRTIERAFKKDVGIHFQLWRSQVRLMKAIGLLVSGYPVKEVAFGVGYQQTSGFVAAFRKTLGVTPKAWVIALKQQNPE